MEIGDRIKQARVEAGLSQRQLCGDTITRNMLSLIESGKARPSMPTLSYLAGQLGKPVGYFLGEQSGSEQAAKLARQCAEILDAAPEKNAKWYLLRGQAAFALGEYAQAAEFLSRAEGKFPSACVPALETCYKELGDFKRAYEYACKQKN